MRKVIAGFIKAGEKLLSQFSALVNLYENNDFTFVDSYLSWLKECENLLEEYNQPEQSKIASIRSVVLAAKRGIHNQNIQIKNNSKKNIASLISILSFRESQDCLYGVLMKEVEKIRNAKIVINQIVLVAFQNNLIGPELLLNLNRQENLIAIWNILNSNNEIKKGLNQVLLTVSYIDALKLLDETITELISVPSGLP